MVKNNKILMAPHPDTVHQNNPSNMNKKMEFKKALLTNIRISGPLDA